MNTILSQSPHRAQRSGVPESGATPINPIVRGWLAYYGRFYRSWLIQSLRRIDDYLVRWAMRKYKRLRGKLSRAWDLLHAVRRRQPALFAHWTRQQPQAG